MVAMPPKTARTQNSTDEAKESPSISRAVWAYVDELPGAVEKIKRGEAQIAAGKRAPLKELRSRR